MAAVPESPTARRIESELGKIKVKVDRLEAQLADARSNRVEWLEAGRALRTDEYPKGVSYRQLADWAGMTNPGVHQLVGPSSKTKTASSDAAPVGA